MVLYNQWPLNVHISGVERSCIPKILQGSPLEGIPLKLDCSTFSAISSNRKLNLKHLLYQKWKAEMVLFVSDRRFNDMRNHLRLNRSRTIPSKSNPMFVENHLVWWRVNSLVWWLLKSRSANSRRFSLDFSRVKLVRKFFDYFYRLEEKSSTIFIFEND